jgi:uncharacterized protein
MKLHADKPHQLSVTAHGEGWIAVNGQRHTQSVVLGGSGLVKTWNLASVHELTALHFAQLLDAEESPPELVVLGTGRRLTFVKPELLQPLIQRRIGFETMDTAAACRTYNILAGEGRRVVAALLIEA